MADAAAPPVIPALSWSERSARRSLLIAAIVALLAWLPGFLMLPPLDRDESRFAEASHQMVESRDFIDIRFASGPRYNKPVGIYWLQATAAQLAGPALRDRIWVYRLPSLVGSFVSLLLLYYLVRTIGPPRAALCSAVLLGTTLLMVAESDIATTDAALLAMVIAAQAVFMRVYIATRENRAPPSRGLLIGAWAAVGAGVLLKGPVILAVLGATGLSLGLWDRDAKWLTGTKPLLGAMIVAVLVAPWAIAIGLASHGQFFQQSLGHDFAAKLVSGEESHGAPPGYYFALANLTFWPATLFLLPALASAILRRREPVFRFLLVWVGAVWLMFELVPTKLPHYILPVYPALAILCALWVADLGQERSSRKVLRYIACAQFLLVAAAFAVASIILPERLGGLVRWPAVTGALVAFALACFAAVSFLRRSPGAALSAGVTSAVLCYCVLGFGIVPELHELWLSPRAAELFAANHRASDAPVILAGYAEPSLVFLLGGKVQINSAAAAARSGSATGGLALLDARTRKPFLAGLAQTGAAAAPVGTLSGLDYSTGREQQLTLFRLTPPK